MRADGSGRYPSSRHEVLNDFGVGGRCFARTSQAVEPTAWLTGDNDQPPAPTNRRGDAFQGISPAAARLDDCEIVAAVCGDSSRRVDQESVALGPLFERMSIRRDDRGLPGETDARCERSEKCDRRADEQQAIASRTPVIETTNGSSRSGFRRNGSFIG